LIDRELVFSLLLKKEWKEIASLLHKNPSFLKNDPVAKQAINLFESEFFSDIESLTDSEKLKHIEYPSLLIELSSKSFSDTFIQRIVESKLTLLKKAESPSLISYANSHQKYELAREILTEIQNKKPENIADARRQHVSINSTDTEQGYPKTIKLFKSKQEQYFFEAIRRSFPTYHPYPNVALSSVLDYDEIKYSLSNEHKNYFFRALIDSVVFDSAKDYEPLYFIELDSPFHDTENAIKKDKLKNEIFEFANTKLIRIRVHSQSECTVDKFQELVVEVMRKL